MKLKDIRLLARDDLDDIVAPYRWSDARLDKFLNEGQNEAARRGRLLVDSTTEEVCQIEMDEGEPLYALDSRVIFVRRVKSSRFSVPLAKIRQRDLDGQYPGWQDKTGEVTHFCLDHESGSLLTYKIPTADTVATLTMTVVRLPLADMGAEDEPELNPRLHPHLRHWAVFRALNLPDERLYRPEKAKDALALFERQFGKESTAVDEAWINQNHGYDPDEGLA